MGRVGGNEKWIAGNDVGKGVRRIRALEKVNFVRRVCGALEEPDVVLVQKRWSFQLSVLTFSDAHSKISFQKIKF